MNHAKIARETISRVYFSKPKRNVVKRKWSKKVKNSNPEMRGIRINKRVIEQVRECSNYGSITSDDVLNNLQDPR